MLSAMPCGPRFRGFAIEPLRGSPLRASIVIANPVRWSHGKACSGNHGNLLAQTSPLDADASRFWEQDPEFHEWLNEMERQDYERKA